MVRETVEQLRNGIIAGPDDLAGIGECINLIESLENEGLDPAAAETAKRLKELFRRIILEDSADPDQDWATVQGLIGALASQVLDGVTPPSLTVPQEEATAASPTVDEPVPP